MARERGTFAYEKVEPTSSASISSQSSTSSSIATEENQSHAKDGLHILLKALARDLARRDHDRED